MIQLDPETRLSDGLEGATDGIAIDLDWGSGRDSIEPAGSREIAGAGQNGADGSEKRLVLRIRERLEQHPHFRGRTSLFQIELVEATVVLSGRLPSHYLKQLLQEAVRLIPDVVDIDNRVLVLRPNESLVEPPTNHDH